MPVNETERERVKASFENGAKNFFREERKKVMEDSATAEKNCKLMRSVCDIEK